jgi:hypothetical protein
VSDTPDRRRHESESPSPPDGPSGGTSPPEPRRGGAAPTPPGRMAGRLLGRVAFFCLDLLGIAGWTWLAIALPLPVFGDFLGLKNAIVAFAAVIWVGRTIIDSFFYDRYPW